MKGYIIAAVVIIIIFGSVYMDYDDDENLKDFCKQSGFEYSERATWKFEDSKCVRIENNTRVESIVDRCGNKWCFVKHEGLE